MSIRGTPWLFVTWCDDIRQEVGNKPSFMGVYTGGLVVPSLPIVLPRLCAHVQMYFPVHQRVRAIKVRVERSDGLVFAEAEIDPTAMVDHAEALNEAEDSDRDAVDSPPMLGVAAALLMGGLTLAEDTKHLRVFVDADGIVFASYRLRVNVAPMQADSRPRPEDSIVLKH